MLKGSEIDDVLKALKTAKNTVSPAGLKTFLPEMSSLKVEEVFAYLFNNHSNKFEQAYYSDVFKCIYLQYSSSFDDVLEEGGFVEYRKQEEYYDAMKKELLALRLEKEEWLANKREYPNKIHDLMQNAGVATTVINNVIQSFKDSISL